MSPERDQFGRYGEADVFRHTLRGDGGGIEVAVIDYGARIQSVQVPDRDGTSRELTLGFDTLAGYLRDRDYLGATIGRCANRIGYGQFSIEGHEYQVSVNNGPHHLHGGTTGFDRRVWRVARRERSSDLDSITFTLESRDDDQGYPGTVNAEVTYAVSNGTSLMIEYRARTTVPTPVNLTNHTYWNLNDSHEEDILDHELTMACPGYLPVDSTLIPLGEVRSVEGTPMDFRSAAAINTRIARVPGGFDHCYVARECASRSEEPTHIATVHNPKNGLALSIATTKPAVQFYTGNFLSNVPGRSGMVYRKHAGLCLEPQYPPDSVNRTNCPEIILKPGDEYRHATVYSFSIQ